MKNKCNSLIRKYEKNNNELGSGDLNICQVGDYRTLRSHFKQTEHKPEAIGEMYSVKTATIGSHFNKKSASETNSENKSNYR